jgi:REP element-mobilizing transposase RayT
MTLFKNKYRIESARLKNWDYTNDAAYFVTICIKDMKNYFGKIIEDKVILTNTGKIVDEEWLITKDIRNNIILDQYIVMPNHFHGIIMILNENKINVETTLRVVLIQNKTPQRDDSTLKSGSLGANIGQFKSVCTKRIHELGYIDFKWQTRFHDRIIRDEKELFNIRQYIINNPIKWTFDKYYKK